MSDNSKNFSFELFPAKTEKGIAKMREAIGLLNARQPEYFSVTYGAGGSTQDKTFATVDWIKGQGIEVAPHLSCMGSTSNQITDILKRYESQGIKRIVALRGDLPSGSGAGSMGELNYANELVALIRERFPGRFRIEVAAYPELSLIHI